MAKDSTKRSNTPKVLEANGNAKKVEEIIKVGSINVDSHKYDKNRVKFSCVLLFHPIMYIDSRGNKVDQVILYF